MGISLQTRPEASIRLKRLENNGVPELKLNQLQLQMKRQIEEKIQHKQYVFETTDCPVCGMGDSEKLGEKDRYGLYYSTNVCKHCGIVYTSPRMNQLSYNEFYNNEYRKLYVGTESATEGFFNEQQIRGKRIHDLLVKQKLICSTPLFVLEVGCGAGGILSFFKEKGHLTKGIDLGEEYLNYGREEHGLDLESGTLQDLSLNQKPDLIIYSHVLEHILDLKHELELMKRFMHENTVIYIEVPGIKNIHNGYKMNILKYFQNAHTYHFTLTSLTNLMSKHNYQLLVGNECVMAAFRIDNSGSETSFTNDYKAVVSYIDRMEKFRMFYPFTLKGLKVYSRKSIAKAIDLLGMRKHFVKLKKSFS